MVSRRELYALCREKLEKAGIDTADFDAMCIFQDMLGEKNPLFLPLEEVPEDKAERIMELTRRRSERYPLQYLLGQWEFFGYQFFVGEGVLIPRPDTELLVENVIEICRREKLTAPRIADLCSGSGCIATALKKELPTAEVYAYELSEQAMVYLKKNAEYNGADIHIISRDVMLDSDEDIPEGGFDIIVSNPPYLTGQEMSELQQEVRHEPTLALFGGNDGLDAYKAITHIWKRHIRKNGWLCYEYGDGQHEYVKNILQQNKFTNITLSRDLGGIYRAVSAQRTEEV